VRKWLAWIHIQTHLAVCSVMKDNAVTVKMNVLKHVTPCSFVRQGVAVCNDVDVTTKLHGLT
jgi:hypothetical protein